jgi:hypothetical protein
VAKIDFTDGTGAATLESATPSPGNRFRNWLPDDAPIGPSVPTLADATIHLWEFRKDYLASFEVPGLTMSQLVIAGRLKIHLMSGGSITITTNDSAARVHTAKLAPGTVPTISGPDENWEYTFSMVARNTSSATMLCVYSGPAS